MSGFLRWTLALLLMFGAAVGAIRLVSGLQTGSFTLLFTQPDGSACERPCLLGVRPGDTTFDAAIALLKTHPVTRDLEFKVINYRMNLFNGRGLTVIVLKTPGGNVASIGVQFFPSKFFPSSSPSEESRPASPVQSESFGDVVAFLGPPSAVYSTSSNDAMWSYYFSDQLIVGTVLESPLTGTNRINVRDSVDFISLVTSRRFQTPGTVAHWFGFTGAGQYGDLAEGFNPLDPR